MILTKDDIVRAGACWSGVHERIEALASPAPTALSPATALELFDGDAEAIEWIKIASGMTGYGDGDGSGYG